MVLLHGSAQQSRRQVLLGLAAAALSCRAGPAWPDSSTALIAKAGLADVSGVALRDTRSGALLAADGAERDFPPASVLKIMTALYALEALGPTYRFRTRLRLAGHVEGDTAIGDLALVGDGDPALDTDTLKGMTAGLAARGIRRLDGRLLVADGSLPFIETIDPGQPLHVGYNPAISGMNLNFNRVWLEWTPGETGPEFGFSAPGPSYKVRLAGIWGEPGRDAFPMHRLDGPNEIWALPKAQMKGKGGVWLPARRPATYAGEVFRDLAAETGLDIPDPVVVRQAPEGTDLVTRESAPLDAILRGMLRYSTNLTAEIVGLRASQARGLSPATLESSAAAMTDWAREKYGLEQAFFVNHSGLSERSRWSASETVTVLAAEAGGPLPDLLKGGRLAAYADCAGPTSHVQVAAKTGTLYFASGLAGYVETPHRRLAFAIYSADETRRAAMTLPAAEPPPGARGWAGRARGLQRSLLCDWTAEYLPRPGLRPMPRPG